jgi:gliding motility-associated-like protein
MKKKYLLLTFFFSVISFTSFAQLDSIFWFGAPDLQSAHGDRPIFLRASSGKDPAVMTISIPANSSFIPIVINLAANSSQSIDLTQFIDLIENGDPNIAANKGLKISSTSLISVYYDIAHGLNGDIYPLKGANALGFKFTIPFQMDFPGHIPTYKTTFVILATENDTRVTIIPKNNLTGMQAGIPTTITLQKGQTYTCEASENTANKRPGGTIVESNKRIAISTKDDSINYLTWGCADTAGDQIIPDCNAGNDFAIMKGYLYDADYYYVFAISDNTVVKVNGNIVSTINAGNYYRGLLSDPSCYIETSNPVHVFHISGFGCELGGAVLPSLMNDGSSSVSLTRASNEELFINVLAPASIIGGFKLNGSSALIDASKFVAVPSTNGKWMTARINLPQSIVPAGGNFQIINTMGKFHAGMIHGGQSSTCRYGYFSDFARSNIDLVGYDTVYCAGDNVSIKASGLGLSNVKWKLPNGIEINDSLLSINNFNAANEGVYLVSGNDSRCGFVERKITLQLQKVKADFAIPLAQCFTGNNYKFISTSSANVGTIKQSVWDFGDGLKASGNSVSYSYAKPGSYFVSLTVNGVSPNCSDVIQKQIIVNPQPDAVIKSDGPVVFCKGESALLFVPKVLGHTYQWFVGGTSIIGATQDTLRVFKEGVYTVSVQSSLGCKVNAASPVTVLIPCEASIWLPDIFTPNGDGINDVLMPVLPGIKKFRCFKIYNRWGQLIFESRDKLKGWDGTYLGKPQPIETYVWQMEGEDIAGKVYTKSGLFSLIR